MKKIVFALGALTLFSCAQKEETPNYVLLNGKVNNASFKTALVRGESLNQQIAINDAGVFQDTLTIEKDGLYSIRIGRESTTIYLEQGGDLHLEVSPKEFDESLTYQGSLAQENNYLAAKYLLNEKNADFAKMYALNESDFLAKVATNKSEEEALLTKSAISNTTFVTNETKDIEYNYVTQIENYQGYHQYLTKNPEFKVASEFYKATDGVVYNDTTAFRNSTAYQAMAGAHFARLAGDTDGGNDFNETVAFLTIVDENLPDGYAKNELMINQLRYGLKADDKLEEAYNIYKNSNPNPENLAQVTERYTLLKTLTKGKPSPEFTYENHKGGETSLKDLSGKYVYIDVWATWCGPCIREIPSLKIVEEEYHNKNIEFVSISIDVEKDYEKWRAMVTDKELGGIQLMADNDWNSKFVTSYGIKGIPRFILVDPQGAIVTSDAPRPSNPELRTLLNSLL